MVAEINVLEIEPVSLLQRVTALTGIVVCTLPEKKLYIL